MNWITNIIFGRKNKMADTKTVERNYSEQMVERMMEVYSANPTRQTAEILAEEFDKPVRSVIAKLSNLGIYKAQARVTKSGAPVIRKEDIVAQIQATVGVEVPTLAKARNHNQNLNQILLLVPLLHIHKP
jgi:phage terminase large subunit-like protein